MVSKVVKFVGNPLLFISHVTIIYVSTQMMMTFSKQMRNSSHTVIDSSYRHLIKHVQSLKRVLELFIEYKDKTSYINHLSETDEWLFWKRFYFYDIRKKLIWKKVLGKKKYPNLKLRFIFFFLLQKEGKSGWIRNMIFWKGIARFIKNHDFCFISFLFKKERAGSFFYYLFLFVFCFEMQDYLLDVT